MKIKCYSVKLKEILVISPKAYLAIDFNGNEDIIPKSQILGTDYSSSKSDVYWISEWILGKKSIQYSRKKCACIDRNTGRIYLNTQLDHHIPKPIKPIKRDENFLRRSKKSI